MEVKLEAIPEPLKSTIGGAPSSFLIMTPGTPFKESSTVKAPVSSISFFVIIRIFFAIFREEVPKDSALTTVCSKIIVFSSPKIL